MTALTAVKESVASFVRGKDRVIALALICLIARGHLLLQDIPGVGKTSLARAVAQSLGVTWNRLQFVPDLLPSDVTGVSIYNQATQAFEFHPGPVFASVVLADEINRATPRTQAALLEAMEEGAVSVDGTTHTLPFPFIVIATQNPIDMAGTYPLPEAQLDRFLMRAPIGYPDHASEVAVVSDHHLGSRVSAIAPVVTPDDVRGFIAAATEVTVDPAIVDYIVALVRATRVSEGVALGASPRGSIGLLRASRARALISGRTFVTPGDIQDLAVPVLAHRIIIDVDGAARGVTGETVVNNAVAAVPAPQPS